MVKTQVIPFRDFMDCSYKTKKKSNITPLKKVITATSSALLMILPKTVFAVGVNSTFGNVHGAIMNAFDAGVVLVIIFSGASWALGHRSKSLEILIGVCCGYVLARHAVDIRDFLKGI
ncbi:glycosyltransferase [Bacillus pseudomycoides]|uniref:glycosyltransferase n=1 Tax=Bacillus pseudomycoides TaxID=64104 RepID=UPI000BF7A91E|nr:glycosyltransferase [Bacillus pseudomycoides]PGA76472.1 glycosyltransferase [Bacillus pseudomycoides]PHE92355.1 glycosyltransferase [Bacillus pseudomycoides]